MERAKQGGAVGKAKANATRPKPKNTKTAKAAVGTGMPLGAGEEEKPIAERHSFVVRLTLDEKGYPRRTEVEHAQSGKKENFPALDAERLVAFMQTCIPPVPAPQPVASITAHEESAIRASTLTVTDVQVLRAGSSGFTTLMLGAAEAFEVQVHFRLQGSGATPLTRRRAAFEISLYANDLITGTAKLLASHRETLAKDVLEYTSKISIPGLSRDTYRLLTLVTVSAPEQVMGYYEGPIIQIVETQPIAEPTMLAMKG